jgi:hypothetical protein
VKPEVQLFCSAAQEFACTVQMGLKTMRMAEVAQ